MNFKKFAHKPWEHPMNDGKLDLAWDSLGSIHRRREQENLRSGYAAGAFADGHVDWVFSQAQVWVASIGKHRWATEAIATDNYPNATEPNPAYIDTSSDFSFTY